MEKGLLDVKYVALYIRKSRGDADTDLVKHRDELVQMCEKSNWKYVEYSEIGTGDSIEVRPKMQEMLRDVEAETFDAVLVVHYDRLGRGDKVDQAKIEKTFAMSSTLIITPQKVYNLNDESDMMLADFQGMIARQEYKAISRRMRGGKRRGALAGNWSNGIPPFPYKYNPLTKKIEPDAENLPIYRLMIEKILNGFAITDIAWDLNKMGIPSPRGRLWNPPVINRILCDEVHLGKIIVGKKTKLVTTGVTVRKPKDEWVVINNCHDPVKTQLEHDKIMFIVKRDRSVPPASRAGKHAFSGLLRCGICDNTLQILKRSDRETDSLKSCTHRDHWGNRCQNFGGHMDVLEKYVHAAIESKQIEIEEAIQNGVSLNDIQIIIDMADKKLGDIKESEKSIERIYASYEKGIYSDEVFIERRDKVQAELNALEEELEIINSHKDNSQSRKNEDMLVTIKDVLAIIKGSDNDSKDLNRAYKSIIHTIYWMRESLDSPPTVKVNFL
jgi:site-specific DNA recombinase